MDQVHVIRHKVLVEEVPIRTVARQLGLSRNTVRKYLRESEPVRKCLVHRGKPVREAVEGRIEDLLLDWSTRTTTKQRVTGSRVHRALREEGFVVGLTTVRAVLRERRRRRSETFVPLVHYPGDEAQVDFFEVAVDVAGERRKAHMFLMRAMYSGRDFAWLYDHCDQVAFLDGHVRAFAHFGGVLRRGIYDNLTPAVTKVLFPKRRLASRFEALVSHYLFEPCFTRPGEGHDKGGVESRGKNIRLQHLTPIPRGETLGEISSDLMASLDRDAADKRDRQGRSVLDRFEEERAQMQLLPEHAFEPRKMVLCSISRRALTKIEGAWYSVPSHWKSLSATAYVGCEEVEIRCRDEAVRHPRQPFGGRRVAYRHYLDELSRKPQALRQVAPELLGELASPYRDLWRLLVDRQGSADASRAFARILGAVCDHGEELVARAIEKAIEAGRTDLIPLPGAVCTTVEVPESLRGYAVEQSSARAYDGLLTEGNSHV
jgi:transposase